MHCVENKIWKENLEALEEMLSGWREYIESGEYKETEEYQKKLTKQKERRRRDAFYVQL